MKKQDVKKGLVTVGNTAAKAAKSTGVQVAKTVTTGLKSAGEKAKQAHHDIRLAHYNPLFPEEYIDSSFDLPNMIVVADEDERKGIPECDGAMGWRSKEAGIEVLHLYEEAVPFSGLHFYPKASIGSVYYKDSFDPKRYIDLSVFHSVVQKDKMTELRNIAHCLGATECRLESYEEEKLVRIERKRGGAKAKIPTNAGTLSANAVTSSSSSNSEIQKRRMEFSQTFEGSTTPVAPELKWFEHDLELNSLIKMVCAETSSNRLKDYTINLDSSSSATISAKQAAKIDLALKKLGASANFSMEGESRNESRQHLVYTIKFGA